MPFVTTHQKKSLNWRGSFFVQHSLALVNRELTLALLENSAFSSEFDLTISQLEPPVFGSETDTRYQRLEERNSVPLNTQITMRHQWPPDFTRPAEGALALIQPWEYGELPAHWIEPVKKEVDEVWVPSQYVREAYLRAGIAAQKVHVVPNGINPHRFHTGVAPINFASDPRFAKIQKGMHVFLFVGGTIARKGADVLLNAWSRAFGPEDGVVLIIKDFGVDSFYQNQSLGSEIHRLQQDPSIAPIVYLNNDMSEQEIASLYASCDCLVHPYRGEGYGLPIAEAMACGKPVIITDYGAALEFTPRECGLFVPSKLVRSDRKMLGDTQTVDYPFWAEPDVEALAEHLLYAYHHPSEMQHKGRVAARHMAENHTWSHAAELAMLRLEHIAARASVTPSAQFSLPGGLQGMSLQDIDEEDYDTRRLRAMKMATGGRWDAALPALEASFSGHENDVDLRAAIAIAKFRKGERREARMMLEEGAAMHPASREMQHNLAFVLLTEGEILPALSHALLALQISPDNSEVRRLVERASDKVLQEARKILRSAPEKQRAKARRSENYTRLMDIYKRASDMLNQKDLPGKARLSLCMIVKNEEQFLRNCLESVKGVVDEIVIVDTGSTDNTLNIAREFGAKIVPFQWVEDFSAARNVSLQHATGDWALWLDADEELAPNSGKYFRYAIENAKAKTGAYLVRICNWLTFPYRYEGGEKAYHHAARLFRRVPGVQFVGRIHEQNLNSLVEMGYQCIHQEELGIDHFGYATEVMEAKNKKERFLRMLHREVEECPEPWLKAFQLFNLANAYFSDGDMENAALYFSQSEADLNPDEEYASLLFVEWSAALHRLHRAAEGLEVCRKADRRDLRHPGIEFSRGYCLIHLERYLEAEQAFRTAIAMGEDKENFVNKSGDIGVSTFKAEYGLALALVAQERYAEALGYCESALRLQKNWHEPIHLAAHCHFQLNHYSEARSLWYKTIELAPQHMPALAGLAGMLYDQGSYAEAQIIVEKQCDIEPNNFEYLARLANCYEHLHNWEKAFEVYQHMKELQPGSAEICVNIGRVLEALEIYAPAIDSFAEAIQLKPEYGNAYFNAGDLLYKLGYYEKATETYLKGLQLEPEHDNGFFVLGNSLLQTGKLEAAAFAYRQEIALHPDHEGALHNLALLQANSDTAAA